MAESKLKLSASELQELLPEWCGPGGLIDEVLREDLAISALLDRLYPGAQEREEATVLRKHFAVVHHIGPRQLGKMSLPEVESILRNDCGMKQGRGNAGAETEQGEKPAAGGATTAPVATATTTAPATDMGRVQPRSARVSPSDLAHKHSVPLKALQGRLDRWRYEHDTGYSEVSNAKKNEPKFIYDEAAVMPIIDALKAKPATRKRGTDGEQKKL